VCISLYLLFLGIAEFAVDGMGVAVCLIVNHACVICTMCIQNIEVVAV